MVCFSQLAVFSLDSSPCLLSPYIYNENCFHVLGVAHPPLFSSFFFSFRSMLGIYCMKKNVYSIIKKKGQRCKGAVESCYTLRDRQGAPRVWQGSPHVEAGEVKSGLCWRPQDGLEDARVM